MLLIKINPKLKISPPINIMCLTEYLSKSLPKTMEAAAEHMKNKDKAPDN